MFGNPTPEAAILVLSNRIDERNGLPNNCRARVFPQQFELCSMWAAAMLRAWGLFDEITRLEIAKGDESGLGRESFLYPGYRLLRLE